MCPPAQAFTEPLEVSPPQGGIVGGGGSGMIANNNWINLLHDLYTTSVKVSLDTGQRYKFNERIPCYCHADQIDKQSTR